MVIEMLETEHFCRRDACVTRLRHQVRLIDEPRRTLTRDPDDHSDIADKLNAVRLIHPTTGERNKALDVAAAD
ncbi:hypothetical protein GCM10009743_19050 [Kribbella swartbergensis]